MRLKVHDYVQKEVIHHLGRWCTSDRGL